MDMVLFFDSTSTRAITIHRAGSQLKTQEINVYKNIEGIVKVCVMYKIVVVENPGIKHMGKKKVTFENFRVLEMLKMGIQNAKIGRFWGFINM